uniref:Uncharacterized protein n=1 Tax=Avena sativa TaxID=4498 RepID=A0ACD5WV27_AVESA
MVDPMYFEVDLKVKGAVQSEDKDLSLLAVCYISNGPGTSCVLTRVATSKLSTLKFTFGHIVRSVEATVSIEILGGKWPEGYRKGVFTASTASIKGMDITLLSFGDGKLPVANGQVKLSRRVICVELVTTEEEKLKPKLLVSVKALHVNEKIGKVGLDLSFKPKSSGRSHKKIKVDCCEMQVTVAWSLLSSFKYIREKEMSD